MKILLTGACGFAGSVIAAGLLEARSDLEILGVDNLSRAGSELNRPRLVNLGVKLVHADVRNASDIDALGAADWVIDAAANPSVLSGVEGATSSRQVIEHNLFGTVNLLEFCKRHRAGFTLLSTSRVYSVAALNAIRLGTTGNAYRALDQTIPGLTPNGVAEEFSTQAPVSLYGATKRASEQLAFEYGSSFGFPVFINRCGVMAGAGQFGKADQGIFSFWIHSYRLRRPLKYLGFDGYQVRDCLHPRDLVPVLLRQLESRDGSGLCNFSGGVKNSMSLRQLSEWCAARFGPHQVGSDSMRRVFDVPWLVLDSSTAERQWQWRPESQIHQLLDEIADHAEANPGWLDLTA